MARDHLLVIDQGTTSSRAVVYDRQARPVGQGQREVLPSYPKPGWVEHDPEALVELGRAVSSRKPSASSGSAGRSSGRHRPDQPA